MRLSNLNVSSLISSRSEFSRSFFLSSQRARKCWPQYLYHKSHEPLFWDWQSHSSPALSVCTGFRHIQSCRSQQIEGETSICQICSRGSKQTIFRLMSAVCSKSWPSWSPQHRSHITHPFAGLQLEEVCQGPWHSWGEPYGIKGGPPNGSKSTFLRRGKIPIPMLRFEVRFPRKCIFELPMSLLYLKRRIRSYRTSMASGVQIVDEKKVLEGLIQTLKRGQLGNGR